MNVKDILSRVDVDAALGALYEQFESQRNSDEGYRMVIDKLRQTEMEPSEYTVHVRMEHDQFDGDWLHVFGTKPGSDETWALGFSSWAEWLGYEVDSELPDELIIAGVLYELTYYGFYESDVERRREELEKLAGEFDSSDNAE